MEKNGRLTMSAVLAAIPAGAGGTATALDFTYPKGDLGFDSFGKRLGGYMNSDAARLGISSGAVDVLEASTGNYSAKLDAVRNVPNHTPADLAAKDEAKAAALFAVDSFIALNLRVNALWTKEDEVKVGFGASGKSNKLRLPPVTHPDGSYINNEPGRLKGKFCDEGTQRAAIADGADSVDVFIEFDNGDGTTTIWTENYSIAHPTIILPRNCCNKRGLAKARWRNNNPVKGPWSDSVPVYCLLMDDIGGNTPVTP